MDCRAALLDRRDELVLDHFWSRSWAGFIALDLGVEDVRVLRRRIGCPTRHLATRRHGLAPFWTTCVNDAVVVESIIAVKFEGFSLARSSSRSANS